MTLFEITGEYLQLLEMMQEADADEQAIADTMEAIEGELEEKADGYARIIAEFAAQTEAIAREVDRLIARKKAMETNIKRLKEFLKSAMIATGKVKFKTALFSFAVAKNPYVVEIAEGAKLPERFLIAQEPKTDRKALIEALKSGEEIDGCRLTRDASLRIR